MKRLVFWLRSSSPCDSLHLQARIVADILVKEGIEVGWIYTDQLSFLEMLRTVIWGPSFIAIFGSFDPWLIPLMKSRRVALVYQNITPGHYFTKTSMLVAFRSWLGRLQLSGFRRDVSCIATSPYNAAELQAIGFRDVCMCPNVVNVDSSGDVHQKTMVPSAIFTGRIVENKNCLELLVQLHHVAKSLPEGLDLVIVGRGNKQRAYFQHFEAMVGECSRDGHLRIQWIQEAVTDAALKKLLMESWLYVSMSLHEGFGLPVCEAIVAGTPALFLECGGTESILGKDGMVAVCDSAVYWHHVIRLFRDSNERASLLDRQRRAVDCYIADNLRDAVLRAYVHASGSGSAFQ